MSPASQAPVLDLSDRNIRQRDIIKPEILSTVAATIIGTGAIGRQVAIQLAAVGVPKIRLIDFDKVGVENLSAQGFREEDLDQFKVNAVADVCKAINSTIEFTFVRGKYAKAHVAEMAKQLKKDDDLRLVYFICVDSIQVRKQIWKAYEVALAKHERSLYVDGRMAAEAANILTVCHKDGVDYYPKTLFSNGDALEQSCTAKTTIYCASLAAGMMVGQFTKWLRGMCTDRDVLYNILACELIRDAADQ